MKHTAITLLAVVLLAACGGSHSRTGDTGTVYRLWNVDVYPLVNYDDLPTIGIAPADDKVMREAFRYTNDTPLADTANINRAIRENHEFFDSLGLNSAWMPCPDSSRVSLVLFDSELLLSDAIRMCEITESPENDENVVVAFKFNKTHEWEYLTRNFCGRRIVVAVNGEIMTAPSVNSPITDGSYSVLLPRYRARQIFFK